MGARRGNGAIDCSKEIQAFRADLTCSVRVNRPADIVSAKGVQIMRHYERTLQYAHCERSKAVLDCHLSGLQCLVRTSISKTAVMKRGLTARTPPFGLSEYTLIVHEDGSKEAGILQAFVLTVK